MGGMVDPNRAALAAPATCRLAGYVLARPKAGHPRVSVSHCLASLGPPVPWASTSDEDLVSLGVAVEQLPAARQWLDDSSSDVEFYNVWREVAPLQEFASRFLQSATDVRLLGVGLPDDRVDRFLADHEATIGQPDGIFELLSSGRRLDEGGAELGWEPICVEAGGISCSWVCNGLPEDIGGKVPFALNGHGLLADQVIARQVMAALWAEPGKEPGLWEAVLLVDYPIQAFSNRW